ncbi:methyl-accepting chemotaxis protein [Alkalibacterium indicireducens]
MIKESNDSTENLNELLKKNESVKSIVEKIQNIASQTNLLALSASIEDARSGKYGLGVGVIAVEVKRLSKQAHESTENIQLDIQAVKNNIDLVVDGNTHLKEHIEQSEKEAEEKISFSFSRHSKPYVVVFFIMLPFGGDNLGIYIPLFASIRLVTAGSDAVCILRFVGINGWCCL